MDLTHVFFSLFSGTVFVLFCLLVLLHFVMSWIHVPDYFQEIKWSCHVYIMLSYMQICCDLNLFCSIKKVRMLLSSTLHINLIHNTFVCTILYYSLRPMKFILTLSEFGCTEGIHEFITYFWPWKSYVLYQGLLMLTKFLLAHN
jgi:hypothetical protein